MPSEGVCGRGGGRKERTRSLGRASQFPMGSPVWGIGIRDTWYGRSRRWVSNQDGNCSTVGKCLGKPIWIELCRFPRERGRGREGERERERERRCSQWWADGAATGNAHSAGRQRKWTAARDGGEQKEEMWKRKKGRKSTAARASDDSEMVSCAHAGRGDRPQWNYIHHHFTARVARVSAEQPSLRPSLFPSPAH